MIEVGFLLETNKTVFNIWVLASGLSIGAFAYTSDYLSYQDSTRSVTNATEYGYSKRIKALNFTFAGWYALCASICVLLIDAPKMRLITGSSFALLSFWRLLCGVYVTRYKIRLLGDRIEIREILRTSYLVFNEVRIERVERSLLWGRLRKVHHLVGGRNLRSRILQAVETRRLILKSG